MVKIIPCLDVKNGQVVKGVNFIDIKEVGSIEDMAINYDQAGADELVLLDISATEEARVPMIEVVANLRRKVSLPIIIGGGIKSLEDVESLIKAGASKVSIASAAYRNPQIMSDVVEKFGASKLVVAIDTEFDHSQGDYVVLVKGGKENTGTLLVDFLKIVEETGVKEILVTSKDKDGAQTGYDQALYQYIRENSGLGIIASGGASNLDNMVETAKNNPQITGLLAASLFHYGKLEISDLAQALEKEGLRD